MKMIHCADVHLDSRMQTHMLPTQAAERNAEITNTFLRLTDYAAENEVRLVLLAGDLFDGARVSVKTMDMVLSAIRRTPKVDYLYLCGNHDEALSATLARELPENLKLFTDTWNTYRYEGVSVSGVEITEQNCQSIYQELPRVSDGVHIVLLHGQIGTTCGAGLINLNLLREKGIDYLALGHLHSYQQAPLDRRGVYCYSGCLEGRGFDECGEKGFVLLDTEGKELRAEFVPFAARTLCRVETDITGLRSNGEILDAMRRVSEKIDRKNMVEYILTGSTEPAASYCVDYLNSFVKNDFYFTKVKDESRMTIRAEDYQNDISLKGEYIRLILASDRSEEEKARLIRIGLEALAGEEIRL